jgi:oxygen-dependent protoporphyrinogen oxidase
VSSRYDVLIIGGGISGMSAAFYAARAGRRCLVLERAKTLGGSICTARTRDGFWYELGAHTLYNSYGSLLEMLTACQLRDAVLERTKAPYRMLVDGKIRSVPSQLALGELFASAWRAFTEKKTGKSVGDYYGRLVGKHNWKHVFSPLLSAVPSQLADDFPAEMLFKRRPRRRDFPRTFSLKGGLSTLVEHLAAVEGVTVRASADVRTIARQADGFVVATADGTQSGARRLVLAAPADVSATLLAPVLPAASTALSKIRMAAIVSTGVHAARDAIALPRLAGLVPVDDIFFSAVSRDVLPDDRFRGLAFHFREGLSREERLERIAKVTATDRGSFLDVSEREGSLPSPELGHPEIVRALDEALAKSGVYLAGNYFGGLALEDCVLRSKAEIERLLGEKP